MVKTTAIRELNGSYFFSLQIFDKMSIALINNYVRFLQTVRVPQVVILKLKDKWKGKCHARPVSAVRAASTPISLHQQIHVNESKTQPIQNVTVVDSTESACHALKALIDAAEQNKYVAWSVQTVQPTTSNKEATSQTAGITMGAYAGEDVDFGNGSHLFIRCLNHQSTYVDQFRRYFALDECQHIWCDYSASLNILATVDIQPRGYHRDIQSMVRMTEVGKRTLRTNKLVDLNSLVKKFVPHWSETMTHDLTSDEVFSRVKGWGALKHRTMRPDGHLGALVIKAACDGAARLYAVHDKLFKEMKRLQLSRFNSPPEFEAEMGTALDAYDNFFRHVDEALYEIERKGIPISLPRLKEMESRLKQEMISLENHFLDWASRQCPDAKYMNPQSSPQLRQLLFAPIDNKVDNKTLSARKRFKVSCVDKHATVDSSIPKKRSERKDIELVGLGLVPQAYLKSGWPSTSSTALTHLCRHSDEFTSEDKTYYSLSDAIGHLNAANEVKLRARKLSKVTDKFAHSDGRLRSRLHYGLDKISFSKTPHHFKVDDDVRYAISASEGNKLLILNYRRLRLWALAQLSGCEALRKRVESDVDITYSGVLNLFEGVEDLVNEGKINAYNSQIGKDGDGGYENYDTALRENYPQTYEIARKVDSAFKLGGGVGGVSRIRLITGCKGMKARELRTRWYSGHPGVEEWHNEWRDMALKDGVVETMMGRRLKLEFNYASSNFKAEAALTEGMQFVLTGTACEAVMGSVTRLVTNGQLAGLGWHVVMVDSGTIVLEGPEYSIDIALPIIRYDAMKPFNLPHWVHMNVEETLATTLGDWEPIYKGC